QYKNNGTPVTMTTMNNAASEHLSKSSQSMFYLICVVSVGVSASMNGRPKNLTCPWLMLPW
ncbi:MAG: hypothetical protein WBN81_16270, partial [Gammaproteobacteria bacterium]